MLFQVIKLNLSFNDFHYIPSNLSIFTRLKWLNLANNKIFALHRTSLENLKELNYLDLSHNNIQSWADIDSEALIPLINLNKLILSHNALRGFPDIIGATLKSDSLRELYLINCSVTDITSDIIEGFRNLTLLDLSQNNVVALNAQIKSSTLKSLTISNSSLEVIHASFLDLPKLIYLDISKNAKLEIFVGESNLEQLDASECDLDVIPKGNFPRLKSVILRGNHLRHLPPNAFESMNNIEQIDLSHNAITNIDVKAFLNTKKLQYVDLSYNTISALNSDTFNSNFKLQKLRLSRNYLRELINLNSESLTHLDLSMCEISRINRHSLSDLPLLKVLDLSQNSFSYIPDDFEAENLNILDMNSCRVVDLNNQTFSRMPKLQKLNLRSNRLTSGMHRSFFHNMTTVYLGDNSWRCECSDEEFRDLHDWLISDEVNSDYHDLICQSPENVEGYPWRHACAEQWNLISGREDRAWMYSLLLILALVILFCLILSVKRAIRLREARDEEQRRQNLTEARQRLQRMRRQETEVVHEVSQNAPDPRELQRPPTYAEAIRMPRLDTSQTSLSGSRGSLSGSKHSLHGSNPDLKTGVKKKRRRRKRLKAASAEDVRSMEKRRNVTEQSASDSEQTLRIYMESDV